MHRNKKNKSTSSESCSSTQVNKLGNMPSFAIVYSIFVCLQKFLNYFSLLLSILNKNRSLRIKDFMFYLVKAMYDCLYLEVYFYKWQAKI